MRAHWLLIGILGLVFTAPLGTAAQKAGNPSRKAAATTIKVLIVMDERPQMEILARYFQEHGNIESEMVDQKALPENWSGYTAVVGYIHGRLEEKTELKIIDYTRSGGRLVCLHHMISSGKLKNKYYFDFLGVRMAGIEQSRQPADPGGHYAWRERIGQAIVNINPRHYITSHSVQWPEKTVFSSSGGNAAKKQYPSLTLEDSEVYMNVPFTDGKEKVLLLGYQYLDDRNRVQHQEATAGWVKTSGKGRIVYIQMGHTAHEYQNQAVAQMVLNAVTWRPKSWT